MTLYRYIGEDERVYPDICIPGEGTLVARAGDEREFEEAPGDGRWVTDTPPPPPDDPPPPVTPVTPLTAED